MVVDVRKLLCAMSMVCKAGHKIISDDEVHYNQHESTGE